VNQARTRLCLALFLAVSTVVAAGCNMLPALPANPFGSAPTAVPATASPPPASPVAVASPTPLPFQPYWVKNFKITEMWSGPAGEQGVVSFGSTSHQFCSFQVVRPQEGGRLYVLNPYSKNFFWIDADAVGPVGPPERRPGPPPPGQNCADAVYEG
jgi:hypothetical protein